VGIAQVIGVAGGEAKAEAILGALRGGHVNVLVTDDAAARKLLALDRAAGE
jgi:deoxyribonucleoside regulator